MTGSLDKNQLRTIEVFKLTTSMEGITLSDAAEIYVRCLFSLALEVADGDCARAIVWINDYLMPLIRSLRDDLAHHEKIPPIIVNGELIH